MKLPAGRRPRSQGRLEGLRAVVTGAGGGIGRALALGICDEGASVMCVDRIPERAEAVARDVIASGGVASAYACDLADVAATSEALRKSLEGIGGVDIVFSNAGGLRGPNDQWSAAGGRVDFLDLDADSWRYVLDANLTSAFNVGLVFARHMAVHGGGAFVYTASQLSHVVRPGLSHYATAKAGLVQLVRAMAVDLAPHRIRVNAIAPGSTSVPVNHDFFARPGVKEENLGHIPMGRMAEPEEMVGGAIFLASPEASYVTGAVLMIDGGYTLT